MANGGSRLDRGEHLDLIVATSQVGLWELDVRTGVALRNLQHDQIFGHDTLLPEWSAETFLSYVVPEDRARVGGVLQAAMAEGKICTVETQIRRIDGALRWISANGTPTFAADGRMEKLIGHVIDITVHKDKELRLELLTREFSHRMSNNMTILNAMIRHVRNSSRTVEDFAETLSWRLDALNRSNRLLQVADAERASFADIVQLELEAFDCWQDRVRVTGDPAIWFTAQASEGLALVLHELSTNALKHGALSVPEGRVALSITAKPGGRSLIRWVESGGPPVMPPDAGSGTGQSVMANAMRRGQGEVSVTYEPAGLVCEVLIEESYRNMSGGRPSTSTAIDTLERIVDSPMDVLRGKRVMVVEDDPIIAFDLTEMLQENGIEVVGPFSTAAGALSSMKNRPDMALMDVKLGLGTSEPVAQEARAQDIPFCVISGAMDSTPLAPAFAGGAVIRKPYRIDEVLEQVLAMALSPATGASG